MGRHDDTFGLASVVNGLSRDARTYFAAGGIGILIGNGRQTYGAEKFLETYYATRVTPHLTLTVNCQHANNPAYNRDLGPASIFGVRAHAKF